MTIIVGLICDNLKNYLVSPELCDDQSCKLFLAGSLQAHNLLYKMTLVPLTLAMTWDRWYHALSVQRLGISHLLSAPAIKMIYP